jgi:hypothetical protein
MESVHEHGAGLILLTERRDHLDYFANQLARVVRHVIVLQDGMGTKATREMFTQLTQRGSRAYWSRRSASDRAAPRGACTPAGRC